jgi:hypothetical protein
MRASRSEVVSVVSWIGALRRTVVEGSNGLRSGRPEAVGTKSSGEGGRIRWREQWTVETEAGGA